MRGKAHSGRQRKACRQRGSARTRRSTVPVRVLGMCASVSCDKGAVHRHVSVKGRRGRTQRLSSGVGCRSRNEWKTSERRESHRQRAHPTCERGAQRERERQHVPGWHFNRPLFLRMGDTKQKSAEEKTNEGGAEKRDDAHHTLMDATQRARPCSCARKHADSRAPPSSRKCKKTTPHASRAVMHEPKTQDDRQARPHASQTRRKEGRRQRSEPASDAQARRNHSNATEKNKKGLE